MRRGEPLNITCPSCGDEDFQKCKSITLSGGHVVDWSKKTEHDWGAVRILVHCQLCAHQYYVSRKQKS